MTLIKLGFFFFLYKEILKVLRLQVLQTEDSTDEHWDSCFVSTGLCNHNLIVFQGTSSWTALTWHKEMEDSI